MLNIEAKMYIGDASELYEFKKSDSNNPYRRKIVKKKYTNNGFFQQN